MLDFDTFVQTAVSSAMPTQVPQVSPGEYLATVDRIALREVDTKNGPRDILEVFWSPVDGAVARSLGRDKVTVAQSAWLDIKDGRLDDGEHANVDLGRIRDALGQNIPGESWVPGMLVGAGPALIHVNQRETDRGLRSQVDRVTRMA